jgi:hypothetical protein
VLDPFVLFLAVAAAWFVLRLTLRRWSGHKVTEGELSVRSWAAIEAGTWALLPILAIPFVPDTGTRPILLLIAAGMFACQFAMLLFAKRFVERG